MLGRLTVNALLKSVITAMAAVIVVLLSMAAWNSWSRLEAAKEIAGVTEAATYLFTASNHIGIDRSSTVRELVSDRVLTEPTIQMREAREALNPALKALVPSLQEIDFPDKAAAISQLDRDIKKHIELQARTLAEARMPKAQRGTASKEYLDLVASMVDQFDKISARLTMLIKGKDNYVDQLLQLKTHAWTIRNTGGTISIMLSNAVSGQPLAPNALTVFNYQLGRADAAWIGVEDVVAGMSLPERLTTSINKVRQDFIGPDYVKARTDILNICLLYTSPSPRDRQKSRMPSSA